MNTTAVAVSPEIVSSVTRAHRLNTGCACESLDRARLAQELEAVSPGFYEAVMKDRPHLFSNSVVYVGDADRRRMSELIAAIEQVVNLPAYQAHVMGWAPPIVREATNSATLRATTGGVFLGYDFHVADPQTGMSPQLIEINTNAGGGLLNAVLARAQYASCDDLSAFMPGGLGSNLGANTPEQLFVDMFRQERRHTNADSLSSVAIVDANPEAQFLYPEFVLFRKLFEQAGLHAVICDPSALSLREGALWHGEMRIDLVYNRLTDFAFEEPENAVLRAAWLSGAALVTPNPRGHALYADKRNLVVLTDDALLAQWGVDAATRAVLAAGIPRTERVEREHADDLWARRKQLFFKPAAGYGSKATYRGDKLTTRVFGEILNGNYIAQALVPPSLRRLDVDGKSQEFKLDLRNYVYDAHVQLVVARLWQGQTTNFRTPGGGFAPVLAVPGEVTA